MTAPIVLPTPSASSPALAEMITATTTNYNIPTANTETTTTMITITPAASTFTSMPANALSYEQTQGQGQVHDLLSPPSASVLELTPPPALLSVSSAASASASASASSSSGLLSVPVALNSSSSSSSTVSDAVSTWWHSQSRYDFEEHSKVMEGGAIEPLSANDAALTRAFSYGYDTVKLESTTLPTVETGVVVAGVQIGCDLEPTPLTGFIGASMKQDGFVTNYFDTRLPLPNIDLEAEDDMNAATSSSFPLVDGNASESEELDEATDEQIASSSSASSSSTPSFTCPCCNELFEGGNSYHSHVSSCYLTRYLTMRTTPNSPQQDSVIQATPVYVAADSNPVAIATPATTFAAASTPASPSLLPPTATTVPTAAIVVAQSSTEATPAVSVAVAPASSSSSPLVSSAHLPPHIDTSSGMMTSSPNSTVASSSSIVSVSALRACVSQLDLQQRISFMEAFHRLSRSSAGMETPERNASPSHAKSIASHAFTSFRDEKVISLLYAPPPNMRPHFHAASAHNTPRNPSLTAATAWQCYTPQPNMKMGDFGIVNHKHQLKGSRFTQTQSAITRQHITAATTAEDSRNDNTFVSASAPISASSPCSPSPSPSPLSISQPLSAYSTSHTPSLWDEEHSKAEGAYGNGKTDFSFHSSIEGFASTPSFLENECGDYSLEPQPLKRARSAHHSHSVSFHPSSTVAASYASRSMFHKPELVSSSSSGALPSARRHSTSTHRRSSPKSSKNIFAAYSAGTDVSAPQPAVASTPSIPASYSFSTPSTPAIVSQKKTAVTRGKRRRNSTTMEA